ncbi:MAG: MmgE/PrpD family protein [Alphaproteobacteria bacterium]
MTGVTAEMASFIANTDYGDIPDAVIASGKVHMLDALGLALAGARAPVSAIVRDHLAAQGAMAGPASILGTDIRTAPRFAAFANGAAMHADNFDDTNPQPSPARNGGIHATAAVLPAVLAVAEAGGRSGRDMEEAFHIGVEVSCKLSHAMGARHYEGGFHTTGTLNVFGAAAASSRLHRLNAEEACHALACAASQAGGVRANFGAMVEQLHTGFAAEGGLIAADLAHRGLTGAPAILEAPLGWFEAAAGGWEADAIEGRLGAPWAFDDPGMWIKPFPNGALTHTGMTLMGDLIAEHSIAADQVARVRVATNRRIANTLVHHRPEDALQAKFSIEFALAVLLIEGRAGLAEFSDEMVQRPDIREMIGRIDYVPYDEAEPGYSNVTTLIEVDLADGAMHSGRADYGLGSTRRPLGMEEITEKFLGCAAYAGWPEAKARDVVALVQDMEAVDDISAVTRLLSV